LAVQLNGNKMNDNTIDKKSFLTQLNNILRSNIRNIIILLSICFSFFIIYQVYTLYKSNKIKNHSIEFFNNQNLEDQNLINETILKLSKENGFYGILSKLELIQKYISDQNYEDVKYVYNELLNDKNLNKTYRSAIATKASYEFIDINFSNLSKDYINIIKDFISSIDDELINFQGVKLELNYLVSILNIEMNNLNYLNNNEAVDLFNTLISSDVTSTTIKERVNKIHEYFIYK
jgi:hypothetical protein